MIGDWPMGRAEEGPFMFFLELRINSGKYFGAFYWSIVNVSNKDAPKLDTPTMYIS